MFHNILYGLLDNKNIASNTILSWKIWKLYKEVDKNLLLLSSVRDSIDKEYYENDSTGIKMDDNNEPIIKEGYDKLEHEKKITCLLGEETTIDININISSDELTFIKPRPIDFLLWENFIAVDEESSG
jgi:hypothetical protein